MNQKTKRKIRGKTHWNQTIHVPSGYVKIAIENGHRNSGFSHEKNSGSFHSYVSHYQRVTKSQYMDIYHIPHYHIYHIGIIQYIQPYINQILSMWVGTLNSKRSKQLARLPIGTRKNSKAPGLGDLALGLNPQVRPDVRSKRSQQMNIDMAWLVVQYPLVIMDNIWLIYGWIYCIIPIWYMWYMIYIYILYISILGFGYPLVMTNSLLLKIWP